ncbi:condensin complex subunit 2 [Helicosporidium sp. ATCC 50920]|nr:condensin complex subunit 2 [Helicosporidium sp. ATCC 50920]|eukprot:KDD76031.1 condensin complex subunit 2 [Helicosporidium sp. ATCC 50920]
MDDLIKTEAGAETEAEATNFQRASVTLDAGIKIYGYRVDSVHNETYKILGGLGRSSAPEEGTEGCGQEPESTQPQLKQRPRPPSSLDPSSTLETSPEALNAKRVDQGPEPDPLFHRMRAQFDRGGPSALLLNNLSVLRGCEVVFDSHARLASLARDAALPAPPDSLAALEASPEAFAALQALKESSFVGPGSSGLSPPLDQIWAMARGPAEPARRAAEQAAIQAIADELLQSSAEDDQRSAGLEREEASLGQMTDGDGMAWEPQASDWDAGAEDAPDSYESGASSAPASQSDA